MAELTFKVKRTGTKNMFLNASKAVKDFKPALKDVKRMQMKEIQEAFKVSGKNIIGTPWKKLSAGYLKNKMASGFLTNILVRTGKMRKSFFVKSLKDKLLQITNRVPYFKDHQEGIGDIPRRQILGHSKKMIKTTLKIVSNYIIKKTKNG